MKIRHQRPLRSSVPPLLSSPPGYLSVLDALVYILKELHAAELKAFTIRKINRKIIAASIKQTGRRFPDGFVALSLCNPERLSERIFTEVELSPDFRDWCRLACFKFQELIKSKIIVVEGDFVGGIAYHNYIVDHKTFDRCDPNKFHDEYVEPRGFIQNYRVLKESLEEAVNGLSQSENPQSEDVAEVRETKSGLRRGRKPAALDRAKRIFRDLSDSEFESLHGEKQKGLAGKAGVSRYTAVRAFREIALERKKLTGHNS